MKFVLKTPLPRLANEMCDVLRLFYPVTGFAVEATAPQTAQDEAKAQFTATPVTEGMEPLTHVFTENGGVWRCQFTMEGRSVERTAPAVAEECAPAAQPAQEASAHAGEDGRLHKANADDLPEAISHPANDPPDGAGASSAVSLMSDSASEPDAPATSASPSADSPAQRSAGELLRRRLMKRLCKLTLYELCRQMTGKQPPWGSLTGIRPTRLLYENMARGLSPTASARALTDMFDVTPEKAELLRRIVTVQQTLPAPSAGEADVYLSIPFCRTRCAYCSFPGEALGKGRQVEPYLTALFAEMDAAAELMRARGLSLRALYIGGGTPTALPEDAFAALLAHAAKRFPHPYEFTVEAGRPDTITRGKLTAMLARRVGRISVNPQTMNDHTLRAIGRDHTAAETEAAFRLARELGFADINMDVIAGLPGETPADFAATMARIEELSPDSLTVHTLAIKRSSRLHLEGTPLPDDDEVAEMVRLGEESACRMGMEPYYLYRQKYMAGQQQNVGYARAGAACLYNVDIMEETNAILACGAGAISKRVFADHDLRIERAPNVTNVQEYIARVEEMARRKEKLFE